MAPTANPADYPNAAAVRADPAEDAEHILIAGDDAEEAPEPKTIAERICIKNRSLGEATELTFYREGFLRARSSTARRSLYDVLLDLKFVDPRFRTATRPARHWLGLGAGSIALTSLAFVILREHLGGPRLAALATVGAAFAICALLMFVYRRQERIEFATRHGRARVLTLRSSFGCLRRFRKAAEAVSRAADRQSGADKSPRYLRAEMQAHYAMRDRGTITSATCEQSTQRILAQFG